MHFFPNAFLKLYSLFPKAVFPSNLNTGFQIKSTLLLTSPNEFCSNNLFYLLLLLRSANT